MAFSKSPADVLTQERLALYAEALGFEPVPSLSASLGYVLREEAPFWLLIITPAAALEVYAPLPPSERRASASHHRLTVEPPQTLTQLASALQVLGLLDNGPRFFR